MILKTFKLFILTCFITLMMLSNVFAQRIVHYTGNESIIIKISHLSITEVQVMGASIASIVMSFPVENISLQNVGDSFLYIQPLVQDLNGDIFIILKEGKSIRLTLVSVDKNNRDTSVRIVFNVTEQIDRLERIQKSGLTPAGLIRAMILEETTDGVAVSDGTNAKLDLPFKTTIYKVYDAVYMKGYIIESPSEFFDIRSLSAQGLIAGAIRNKKIYLVFANLSSQKAH